MTFLLIKEYNIQSLQTERSQRSEESYEIYDGVMVFYGWAGHTVNRRIRLRRRSNRIFQRMMRVFKAKILTYQKSRTQLKKRTAELYRFRLYTFTKVHMYIVARQNI